MSKVTLDQISENISSTNYTEPKENSNVSKEGSDFSWINIEYLEPRLQKHYKDETLKIKSLEVAPASGKGDGYGGIILRVFVTYTAVGNSSSEEKISFIVKTQIWDELTSRTQKMYDIVQKEIDMYANVLPKIKNLLLSIGLKNDFFPETISVDNDDEIIVMEDLILKNYVMLDRLKGLPDRAHFKLFLERLAQSHAASAVLYERDRKIYKNCPFGMFNRVTTVYHYFFYTFWDAMCNEVGRWFGFSYYAEKLKNLRGNFIENACRVYDNEESDFCVLTHGDMWINNVMFNYNSNNTPKDCVLFDYQYAYFGTPFIDLLLFIYSSTDNATRQDHDEYMQYYYVHLKQTLEKLAYQKKIPTLFEFRQQYLKKSFLKLTAMFIMTPIMTNELGDMADLEALLVENENSKIFAELCMKRPTLQETVKRLLPVFDRQGLLDELH